jgi:hypothetical protein
MGRVTDNAAAPAPASRRGCFDWETAVGTVYFPSLDRGAACYYAKRRLPGVPFMTHNDFAGGLAEVDRLLNDPSIPMQPAEIWRLTDELAEAVARADLPLRTQGCSI